MGARKSRGHGGRGGNQINFIYTHWSEPRIFSLFMFRTIVELPQNSVIGTSVRCGGGGGFGGCWTNAPVLLSVFYEGK